MTIHAKIIADSTNPDGERLLTYELEYPRFIHSEFMTHRDFSRNASSSRAIPINRMIALIWKDMAKPIHWGKKQSGMQAREEVTGIRRALGKFIWSATGTMVLAAGWLMEKIGIHKQVANRMMEPWSHIKVVMTTAKMRNWENLRLHTDAQPEIHELAIRMRKAMYASVTTRIEWGAWHLPYVTNYELTTYHLGIQKQISASCAAQVSYRRLDSSVDKAKKIYDMLINADVIHASPFEHPAKAVKGGGTGNFSGTGWRQLRADSEEERRLSDDKNSIRGS